MSVKHESSAGHWLCFILSERPVTCHRPFACASGRIHFGGQWSACPVGLEKRRRFDPTSPRDFPRTVTWDDGRLGYEGRRTGSKWAGRSGRRTPSRRLPESERDRKNTRQPTREGANRRREEVRASAITMTRDVTMPCVESHAVRVTQSVRRSQYDRSARTPPRGGLRRRRLSGRSRLRPKRETARSLSVARVRPAPERHDPEGATSG